MHQFGRPYTQTSSARQVRCLTALHIPFPTKNMRDTMTRLAGTPSPPNAIAGGRRGSPLRTYRAVSRRFLLIGVTSAEFAEMLGVSLPTLRNWIAPRTSKTHRTMPRTAQLLLDRILADDRTNRR